MPVTIETLSRQLSSGGVRHHMDAEDRSIRIVFVTKRYVNARGEKLVIIRLTASEMGAVCRVVLERAFAGGPRLADTCLSVCEALADTPCARVEHDPAGDSLRLAAELPVEDGELTSRQLFALLDAVVAGAEAGQAAIAARGEDGTSSRAAA